MDQGHVSRPGSYCSPVCHHHTAQATQARAGKNMKLMARRFVTLALALSIIESASGQIVMGPLASSPAVPFTFPQSTVDLDADGDLDLVVQVASGIPRVRFGDGRGHFGPEVPISAEIGGLADLEAGDLDGDGHADIVAIRTLGPSRQLYILKGSGGADFALTAIHEMPGVASSWVSGRVGLMDANGDGHLDALVTMDGEASEIYLCLNDGAGGLTVPPPVVSPDPVTGACAADLDGDGTADIVAMTAMTIPLFTQEIMTTVLIGQGGGDYGVTQHWHWSRPIGIQDLDADGILDVLTYDIQTESVQARLGLGNGSFADGPITASTVPVFVPPIPKTGCPDFDGDGRPDLLVEALPFGYAIRRGDGRGGFESIDAVRFSFGLGNPSPPSGLVADVVTDGRPDLLVVFSKLPIGTQVVTMRNSTYPAGGPLLDLGHAKSGSSTWPTMIAAGEFQGGDAASFHMYEVWGMGVAQVVLVAGLSQAYAPFHGGVMVPAVDLVLGPFAVNGSGEVELSLHWPQGIPSGTVLTLQYWNAFQTQYSATSAVQVTTP
jgi:hypothetical protein